MRIGYKLVREDQYPWAKMIEIKNAFSRDSAVVSPRGLHTVTVSTITIYDLDEKNICYVMIV